MSQKENITARPQSRFIEHFDIIPPAELLDMIDDQEEKEEEEEKERQRVYLSADEKLGKKPTPLYGLSTSRLADNHLFYSPTPSTTHSTPSLSASKVSNKSKPMNATTTTTTTTGPIKLDKKLRSLNKADVIIKRYESWYKFIILFISWLSEIERLCSQSKRTYQLLSDTTSSKSSSNKSVNDIQATLYSFTTDLALQEKKLAQAIQNEHLPSLEQFKKQCNYNIKSLKNQFGLGLGEFLRRAEVTASFMAQLAKTCKDARGTIENGAQVTNDPWLVNLFLLRRLKREVDEENRLRKLMVPIQKTILTFENQLLVSVQNAIKTCFNKPGVCTEQSIQILNHTANNSWDTFVSLNQKDLVDEANPLKQYLNINYPCKNDPLVMTVHKGQLERKIGVLSKYSERFFVLTQSGFLHQFKLNDKMAPEYSIYLPKCNLLQSKDAWFEIQRSGSVLQRDKSYVFRTSSSEEMATWCKLLSGYTLHTACVTGLAK
ncbi:hypothetical protein HPULCUR_007325 [Helicostylum pulchrum]|uniref:PH domain-containing protein n=1 Tax=Helicostylum pulchrum TaxID=562976 RepID=A0ABP9Y4G7_9FUNG